MRESRPYGSVRGARDETRVPTATKARIHHAHRLRGGDLAAHGARAAGGISLQEFQAAHERIFKAMDANKDGRLTLDEIQAFMQGTRRSAPQQ